MERVSNRKLRHSPESNSQKTGNDFYCSLCSIDCINSTGKLLHVLEPEHIVAYQSSLKVPSKTPRKCSILGSKTFETDDRWKLFTLNVSLDEACQQPERFPGLETRLAPASGDKTQPHIAGKIKVNNISCDESLAINCKRMSIAEDYSRGFVSINSSVMKSSKKRKKSNRAKKKSLQKDSKEFLMNEIEGLDGAASQRSKLNAISDSYSDGGGTNIRNLTNFTVISSENSGISCCNAMEPPKECFQGNHLKDVPQLVSNGRNEKAIQHEMAQFENESGVEDKSIDMKFVNSSLKLCSLDDHNQEASTLSMDSSSEQIPQNSPAALKTPFCNTTRRIVVEGFPAETDKRTIMNRFSGYGFIKSFLFVGSVIHIEYFDWHSVERIMGEQAKQKINVLGHKIQVKKNLIKPIKEFQIERIPDYVQRLFSSENYFMKNLNTFVSKFCLGPSEMHKQLAALKSIISCMEEFGPSAHPFGSRVSGFANIYSDLDIFIDITKPNNLIKTKSERSTQAIIIHQAAEKLRKSGQFKAVNEIANASVPIVRCKHLSSGLKCDLSFLEPSGVYNTRLILYYLSLDTRVKPLILLIRYWASTHCLSGTAKFTNYCLSILCIFYLQQIPDEPILPSVSYLMNVTNGHTKLTVGCWNYDFCENFTAIERTANKSSVFQLMKGFFKFYYEFDAQNLVISPFIGKFVKKSCFEPGMEHLLPKEFSQYKLNILEKVAMPFNISCIFCVQDPFVHNNNLGKQIGASIFQHFQICCGLYIDDHELVYKYCAPFKRSKSYNYEKT